MLQYKCKNMGVNMEDEELMKIFNPTLNRRETILLFLIVMINGLTWIVSDIGLNMCARGRWRVEVFALCVLGFLYYVYFYELPFSICFLVFGLYLVSLLFYHYPFHIIILSYIKKKKTLTFSYIPVTFSRFLYSFFFL